MRKNVLFSILAMTSAAPMAGYANANLGPIITDDADKWQGDDSSVSFKDGIIVAPGSHVLTQDIGKMLPGTYKVAATTLSNAKITVSGKELDANGEFTISVAEGETDGVLTIQAVDKGKEYTAGGITVELVYNFAGARNTLNTRLAEVTAKIEKVDGDKKADYSMKASEIANDIASLADDGADSYAAYANYRKFELYKGVESSTIYTGISRLESEVDGNIGQWEPYQNAVAAITEMENALSAAKNAIAGIADPEGYGTQDYVRKATESQYNAAKACIDAYNTAAGDAYNTNGDADKVCSDTRITEFKTEAQKLINEYSTAISNAAADHPAYKRITAKLAEVKNLYSAAITTIHEKVQCVEGHDDVFGALRTEAQNKLNEANVGIMEVERSIGSDESHPGVAGNEDENIESLTGYGTVIAGVQTQYVQRAETLNAAYTAVMGNVESLQADLDSISKSPAVHEKHGQEIAGIQTLIDKLKGEVETDYAAYTITSDGYATELAAISKANDDLGKSAQPDIDNYNAYTAVKAAIDGLQEKFDTAKAKVNALKSSDNAYVVNGKYTAEETALQTEITGYLNGLETADKEGTCVDYQTKNSAKIDAAGTKVSDYEANATTALGAYENIIETIAEITPAIEELKGVVTNGDVPVSDGSGKTYGGYISGFETSLSELETARDNAKTQTGNTHSQALIAASAKADALTVVDQVAALKKSYETDKKNYDDNVVTDALNLLITQANDLIDEKEDYLDGITYTSSELGLSYDEIMGEFSDLKNSVIAQRDSVKAAQANPDKAAAMAILYRVQAELNDIQADIDKVQAKAQAAITKVNNNDTAKTEADNRIKAIRENIEGNSSSTIKGIVALNEDASRDAEFMAGANELAASLGTIETAIADARGKETLDTAWQDGESEDGTVIKGFATQLDELADKVDSVRTEAIASTDNYNAWTKITDYVDNEKLADDITAALVSINGLDLGESLAHYKGLLDGYKADLDNYVETARKAYNDKVCAEQSDLIMEGLEDLNDLIGGVTDDAKSNKEYYEDQVENYNGANAKWAEVYYKISTGDQTSGKDAYLAQLTDLQTQLNNVKTDIDSYFAGGESVRKDGAVTPVIDGIKGSISQIEQQQFEEYDAFVQADNDKRLNEITTAVGSARTEYSNALGIIEQYNSITNPDLLSVVTPAVNTANSAINGMLSNLRTLQGDAEKERAAATGTTLFDKDETYKAQAEAYEAAIKQAVSDLDAATSPKAHELFDNKYAEAQGKLTTATATLKGAGYSDDVVKEAFADVEEIIDNAGKAEAGEHFAVYVNGYLEAFAGIDDMLNADKEQAAKDEYAARMAVINLQIDARRDSLKTFEYPGDADGTRHEYHIQRYEELIASTVTLAENMYAGNADAPYAVMPQIIKYLDAFTASNVFEDAKAEAQDEAASQATYDETMKLLAGLRSKLDDAAEYVDAYVITNDCGVPVQQTEIDNFNVLMDNWLGAGSCHRHEADIDNRLDRIERGINGIYATANNAEDGKLTEEMDALKGYQNLAAEAVYNDPELSAEVEAYTDSISKLKSDYAKATENFALGTVSVADMQATYLTFEGRIATLRAKLTAYYNGNLGVETAASLTGKLDEVETSLVGITETLSRCHQPVKDKFAARLEAVRADVDGISADIESRTGENSILFYSDKITNDIAKVESELSSLETAINTEQAPYTANENAKARLDEELEGLKVKLESTIEKLGGYKFYDINAEQEQNRIKNINQLITLSGEELDKKYANVELNDDSELLYQQPIENQTRLFDEDATYTELHDSIASLDVLLANVSEAISSNLYAGGTKAELEETYKDLLEQKTNLNVYNNDAKDGSVRVDIDGNPVRDEQGLYVRVDYLGEAVPAIWERLNTLGEGIAQLDSDAKEYSYILGDVNHDGSVLVDDYARIMNIVLEREDVEDGSLVFLAADVNADGSVNIGDITKVTNIIMNDASMQTVSLTSVTAKAAAAPMVTDDALSLTSTDEGETKRIAVRLAASKAYVGCQLDVKLPAGVTLLNENLGETATDHQIYSNTLTDGTTHRIVISSMQNSELNNGEDVLVYLDVTGRNASRTTVAGVMLTDASGRLYSVVGGGADGTTGIDGVNAEMTLKEKIYSVGGQVMDTIKKGVNIIRRQDGSTKKVIGK